MHAVFESLELIKGSGSYLKQGVKGNKVPPGAIAGSNGSFIIKGTNTKIYLTVKTDDGKSHSAEVYRTIMQKYGLQKLHDSRFEKIKADMATKQYDYNPETREITWD